MTEDNKSAAATDAPAQEAQPAAEKTPEQLAADEAARIAKEAKAKAKKEAAAANKAAKEAKKAERLAKKQAEEAAKNVFVKDPNDPCADKFGDVELNRSQCDPELRFQKKYTQVKALDASLKDQEVRVRCRVHNSRSKGKMCFLKCRESYSTVQAVLFVGENISKGMVTFSSKIPKESIIEIVA